LPVDTSTTLACSNPATPKYDTDRSVDLRGDAGRPGCSVLGAKIEVFDRDPQRKLARRHRRTAFRLNACSRARRWHPRFAIETAVHGEAVGRCVSSDEIRVSGAVVANEDPRAAELGGSHAASDGLERGGPGAFA
jgi:hypothetical protein